MDEKKKFSLRLAQALKRAGVAPTSPTRLALEFNLHHPGRPVSTQAVHKWLNGLAIPAQDKIRTLAAWLGVTPEWLRFGDSGPVARPVDSDYSVPDVQLQRDFHRLSEEHRQVVREVVAALLRIGRR